MLPRMYVDEGCFRLQNLSVQSWYLHCDFVGRWALTIANGKCERFKLTSIGFTIHSCRLNVP